MLEDINWLYVFLGVMCFLLWGIGEALNDIRGSVTSVYTMNDIHEKLDNIENLLDRIQSNMNL